MHTGVCVCVCVCVCVYIYIYTLIFLWGRVFSPCTVCLCVCVCVHIHVYMTVYKNSGPIFRRNRTLFEKRLCTRETLMDIM